LGAVGIVELKNQVNMEQVQQKFVRLGVWVRPFRNLVYIMPPYIITPAELTKVTDSIIEVVTTSC
ncbi:MAG: aminotransferase class III-fold pyridoxal phosphate-dependent enzyme, partial [Proteobacteria bacterium]|nr:aminotransferase class III-fold pyridoxal phosphate-dependent enzyme [Pseudomonadota bacterium]